MKKYLLPPFRPGVYNLFLSVCYVTVCYLHLINFYFAAFLFLPTITATSLNILCYRRHFSFASLIQNGDHFAGSAELVERKTQSIIKLFGALLLAVTVYYVGCILFGAPLTELYYETLYFSCIMTFLTIYPFCWYSLQSADGIYGIIHILFENRCENSSEYHLSTMAIWSIYGAWFGAFPIPLDWDRPWQQWPITCCVGAILGCTGVHLYIGTKTLWMFCVERRKSWKNFV